jgi:hypothetical protein
METHEILLHAREKRNKIGPLNLVKVKKLDAKLVTKAHFITWKLWRFVEGGPN